MEALQTLETQGGEILFSSEGEEEAEIYAHLPEDSTIPFDGKLAELPSIDWQGQWDLHGVRHLEVGGKQIEFIAGPGFGDYSHSTTQLMIELMEQYLQGDLVIDVGCGSGILSLTAIALGAKRVIGIDIDQEALDHSRENARINEMEGMCYFCLPGQLETHREAFLLMNMITSEQKVAWESVKHIKGAGLITSGVLAEEKEEYLKWLEGEGWSLVAEKEKEGWLAFYCILL